MNNPVHWPPRIEPGITPRPRTGGFTLIEMLAVVSVVCVLAAVLMSGFKLALDSSKRAKCVGNLRALGGALGSYYAETGSHLNRASVTPNPSGFLHQFPLGAGEPAELFFSYLNDPRVFFCPANNQARTPAKEYKEGAWLYATYLYCFDTYGSNGNWSAHGISAPRRLDSRGANASRIPMMMDMAAVRSGEPYFLANHVAQKGQAPRNCNILFVDGHVADSGVPTEVFWGGGNPNFLWPKEVGDVVKKIQQN